MHDLLLFFCRLCYCINYCYNDLLQLLPVDVIILLYCCSSACVRCRRINLSAFVLIVITIFINIVIVVVICEWPYRSERVIGYSIVTITVIIARKSHLTLAAMAIGFNSYLINIGTIKKDLASCTSRPPSFSILALASPCKLRRRRHHHHHLLCVR